MCRTLAAPSLIPRAVAICAIERASMWRIARSLRSPSGNRAIAARTRWQSSSRIARPLGLVPPATRCWPAAHLRLCEEDPAGRPLAIDAPLARAEVMPMKLGQTFQGELTEPRQERQGRILQVGREPQGGVCKRLLDDVRRVDPRGQPPVEPAGDQSAKSVAMPGQDGRLRERVAPACPLDQSVSVVDGRGHEVEVSRLTVNPPRPRRRLQEVQESAYSPRWRTPAWPAPPRWAQPGPASSCSSPTRRSYGDPRRRSSASPRAAPEAQPAFRDEGQHLRRPPLLGNMTCGVYVERLRETTGR